MKKHVLLVGDMVGVGRVGITASASLLSSKGYLPACLPTTLVSNNFGYGRYAMTDTAAYMAEALEVWPQLGFAFDAVMTGFIPTEAQANMLLSFCKEHLDGDTLVLVDPILGDEGVFYKGLSVSIIDVMRRMLSVAHVACPNYTEACFLTDTPYEEGGKTLREAYGMVGTLCSYGAQSVLITSIKIDGSMAVVGYDGKAGDYFVWRYDEIPVQFSGTGDIFSALLVGHLLEGEALKESTYMAMQTVYEMIDRYKEYPDKYLGLPF